MNAIRPIAPKPEIEPGRPADLLAKALLALARSRQGDGGGGPINTAIRMFGMDPQVRAIIKAVTEPANTTGADSGSVLLASAVADLIQMTASQSAFGRLVIPGLRFDQYGAVVVPGRLGKIAPGGFVPEGGPIPVKKPMVDFAALKARKVATLTAVTREVFRYSAPVGVTLIRDALVADTAATFDALLLDNVAGSATRPAGLQVAAGAANSRASTGATATAIVTDMKAAMAALFDAGYGAAPVWVMHRRNAAILAATDAIRDAGEGTQAFGIPILASIHVPKDVVALLDADGLAAVIDGAEIDASENALIHMDDAALAIASGAAPGGVASPVTSMWQSACVAIRTVIDADWSLREPAAAQVITGVAWN